MIYFAIWIALVMDVWFTVATWEVLRDDEDAPLAKFIWFGILLPAMCMMNLAIYESFMGGS